MTPGLWWRRGREGEEDEEEEKEEEEEEEKEEEEEEEKEEEKEDEGPKGEAEEEEIEEEEIPTGLCDSSPARSLSRSFAAGAAASGARGWLNPRRNRRLAAPMMSCTSRPPTRALHYFSSSLTSADSWVRPISAQPEPFCP